EQTRKLIGDNSLNNLLKLISNFEDAKEYGSILKLDSLEKGSLEEELHKLEVAYKNLGQIALFAGTWNMEEDLETLRRLITQQENMTQKYDVVITNPPYMGGKGYSDILKKYIEKNYKDSKADLFAVFMERCSEFTQQERYTAMITMHSWMFLSSFETLRKNIIDSLEINTLNHLGTRAFEEIGGEVVQTVSWVTKKRIPTLKGSYIRLVDYNNSEWKEKEFFNKENYFTTNQKDFEKIPGSPIAYWVSERVREIFEKNTSIGKYNTVVTGMSTGKNELFLRLWQEINFNKMVKGESEIKKINLYATEWIPYNKGGEARKFYGNNEYVVRWSKSLEFHRPRNTFQNFYLKPGLTWSFLTSSIFSMRYFDSGFLWDVAGSPLFIEEENLINYYLGYLSTKQAMHFMNLLNPTLNYQVIDIQNMPIIISQNEKIKNSINTIVKQNIQISKQEWDSRETSWDFEKLGLIEGNSLKEGYEQYCEYWKDQFFKMHSNEEELNRMFIEIYGLEDEMDEKVELTDITLLKKEANIVDGELVFNKEELMKQFLSYAVGCIMGRYSVDKPGLIIANSDDVMKVENNKIVIKSKEEEVRHEITNPRFIPDAYGIVPVLREDSFENDIVSRVIEFVKAVYGEDTLQENLNFIAEGLGKKSSEDAKDVIRKYFIKDFYKDHLQRYKKRPIYWMMNSGKKDAFSTLIYLHRYEENSIGRVRADYLLPYQEILDNQRAYYERLSSDENTTPKDKKDADKRLKELDAELKELKDYANEVKHIADQKISLDLDDGVKVNYEKFGKILSKM
ncbi:BREX-1 system adenine-specific DNA-methyltransferase PglX, partial [Cetobacterium sp.]|uniref:BREX-1 system adenine-specific DNA-methyltransferase PglX n=1 Tax=Cetobacterium sp. TaxID=2071632 RepID=UPI003F349D21